MIDMKKPASEQELLNAGFEVYSSSHLVLVGNENIKIYVHRDYNGVKNSVQFLKDKFSYPFECPTKTELNKMLYPFIKRELFFEKKVKQYSWEECYVHGHYITEDSGISYANRRSKKDNHVYRTEAQAKQALALAQLSHIIAEIDKDYPMTTDKIAVILPLSNNKGFFIHRSYPSDKGGLCVSTKSKEGAEILMTKHEELLKLALMVE